MGVRSSAVVAPQISAMGVTAMRLWMMGMPNSRSSCSAPVSYTHLFIPVSEDAGMIKAAEDGVLSIEKLEAMTCVCSVGLDMIAIPGDTTVEAIAGIIADAVSYTHLDVYKRQN